MAGHNDEIAIKIGAKDEASKVIDKLAKKIDGMEADEARITITAQTDKLEAQLDRAKKKLEGLDGDEATVQSRLIGSLEADLDQAKALFNELDGKTGTVHLGVDVDNDKLDTTRQRIDDVGKSAGSSKSVLANMVGNTTQDLGALGGVAGSAGVAIGQMGEYMADARAEGEGFKSIFKNFANVGAPIAAVSIALAAVQKVMGSIADTKAFNKKQIEDFGSAIEDVGVGAASVLETLKDTREVTGRAGGVLGGVLQDTKDITKDLQNAGVTVDEFTRAVARGGPALDAVVGKLGAWGDAASAAYAAGTMSFDQSAAQSERARDAIEILNETHKNYQTTVADRTAWDTWIGASEEGTAATQEQTDAWVAATSAAVLNKVAVDEAGSAAYEASRKARLLADKVGEFNAAYDEMQGRIDRSNAALDLANAFDAARDAAGRAYLLITDKSPDAEQAVRDLAGEWNNVKDMVLNYRDELGRLPPETITRINAIVDEGDLDRAERELANVSRNRDATIRIQLKGGAGYAPLYGPDGKPIPTMAPSPPGVTPFAVTTATTAGVSSMVTVPEVVVPVRLKLPSSTEISRRIGPLNLAIAAGLRANERLVGIRD